MRLSWKIGRVAGIDLYVHATFLLVFLFFPDLFEGGPRSVLNVLLILSVFGCVLLHELGHALMARRFGIQHPGHHALSDRRGGAARADAAGTRCRAADRAGGSGRQFRDRRGPDARWSCSERSSSVRRRLRGISSRNLLLVNLVLGLFNLIPAFPMDGGRVLRALLSGWLGRAGRRPSPPGSAGSWPCVFGVVALLWTHNPIHLALAAFIYFAARAEEAQVLFEERRRGFER